ncbi:GAF and ANTAR domain-containing protein [Rhodococcus sp. NPDC003318]|uniref:GAF and ANTAR domain-containing protein n=1 Tax=Rhodococcus sp. NPDC003318 TaxID=3364503 RepID=UPI00367D2B02
MSDQGADPVDTIRASLLQALRSHRDPLEALVRTCQASLEVLAADGMSVAVATGSGYPQTVFASDETVERIESLQFTLGVGPCIESIAERGPVLVPDLAESSDRWPVLVSELATLPVGAIFAFPLQAGSIALGSLNLYRNAPGFLDTTELARALRIGDVITIALLGLAAVEHDAELDRRLAHAPHNSDVVHQATGMLVSHYQIPASAALVRLRAYAFASGRLVEEVARLLTTRQLRLEDIDA